MDFRTKQKKKMSDKRISGHLYALTANVLWGLMAPIGKSALQEFSAVSVTTFRMTGAAIAFWILSAFMPKEQIPPRDMLKIFFASMFALTFNQGMYIFGLSMTSPIDASIVTTTLPIITMIVAAIFLKEPITNKKVLGIFVGAMGALILICSGSSSAGSGSIWGDLLCMVAQLSFSIYLTVFKSLTQKYSVITLNKWMFIYASMCYIPLSYNDIAAIEWSTVPTATILQVLYIALAGSFLAYIFIMTAQKMMRPTVVSMYNYMQPIVASIASIVMGVGVFGWQKGVAIALVFAGVYIVTQSKSKADMVASRQE
jgi:drug/metabolite transporter (DMT)-like permease